MHSFKWDSKHTNDSDVCWCGERRMHRSHDRSHTEPRVVVYSQLEVGERFVFTEPEGNYVPHVKNAEDRVVFLNVDKRLFPSGRAEVPIDPSALVRRVAARRGEDFACENCEALKGSTKDTRGVYRCNACGQPSS